MNCVFFSDLHIKKPGDKACDLFQKLCSHDKVKNATHIFLLGDLFDLLIGEHPKYFEKYSKFFNSLIELLDSGKKIIFLEGNHDFRIKKSLLNYIKNHSENFKNFKYLTEGEVIQLNDKKYYYCHGDEVDFENEAFKKWKRMYTSNSFALLINKVLTFKMLEYLGKKAAENSKKRGKKTFDLKKMKMKYRNGAEKLIGEKGVHGVIGGHTHIQEDCTFKNGTRYLNCGHPLTDKNFLYFDGREFSFVSLTDS